MGIFKKGGDDFDAPTTVVEDLTGDWTLDPSHTRIGFSARHAMVTTVRGQFTKFEGSATSTAPTQPPRRSRSPSRATASTPATPTATLTCARVTSSRTRPTPTSPSSPPRSSATATTGPSPAT